MKTFEWKPLAKEDFSEAPYLEKLIRPLNTVLGQLRAGVTNGLTLGENLNAEVKTVDVSPRTDLVPLTLLNGWTAYAGYEVPSYRWSGGLVELHGVAQAGTLTQPIAQATLFPPAHAHIHATVCDTASATTVLTRVDVTTAGNISLVNYPVGLTWVSLEGVCWEPTVPPRFTGTLVRFKTRVKSAAGVVVLRAVQLSGRDQYPVYGLGSPTWVQDGENITISSVTGLAAGSTYRLALAILGG